MANIFTYNPDEVRVLLAGMMSVDGFVDGSFISVDKDEPPYRSRSTADGQIIRMYKNSQSYTITLTLHIGATANSFLTKLWQLDEITQRGKFPVIIKDGSGSDLFFSATSWIEGLPSLTKSNEVDTRVWRIKCSSALINYGSNSGESGIIEDLVNIASSALPSIQGIF